MLVFLFFCGRSLPSALIPGQEKTYINAIQENDVPLKKPRPGEWLYEHKESGQNLAAYQQLSPPVLIL